MKKDRYVFAVTRAELIDIYGNSPQLRELLEKLERSRDAQKNIGLLLRFDEADWLKWSRLRATGSLRHGSLASAQMFSRNTA